MNDTQKAAEGQPMWKPAPKSGRATRQAHRQQRTAVADKVDRAAKQEAAKRDRAIRHHCFLRDRKRDRAFGAPLLFNTDNLKRQAQSHHIVFRSAGGSDDTSNRLTLSFKAHSMIHDGELDCSGNADVYVQFDLYEFKGGTRHFVRRWWSTPSHLLNEEPRS